MRTLQVEDARLKKIVVDQAVDLAMAKRGLRSACRVAGSGLATIVTLLTELHLTVPTLGLSGRGCVITPTAYTQDAPKGPSSVATLPAGGPDPFSES
jgi:hypothetical protein